MSLLVKLDALSYEDNRRMEDLVKAGLLEGKDTEDIALRLKQSCLHHEITGFTDQSLASFVRMMKFKLIETVLKSISVQVSDTSIDISNLYDEMLKGGTE